MRRSSAHVSTMPFVVPTLAVGRVYAEGFAALVGELSISDGDARVIGRIATFFRFTRPPIIGTATVMAARAYGGKKLMRLSLSDKAGNTVLIEGDRASYNGDTATVPAGLPAPISIIESVQRKLEHSA